MNILETERLILRHFQMSDLDAMTAVFCDPEVMRFSDGVKSAPWVHEWLGRRVEDDRPRSSTGPWAVVERTTSATIGYCGLFHVPDVCGQPETEIGYRLARPYWGHGHATEVVRGVRNYAFGTLGLSRLIAMIDPGNVRSIRVAEKIGMHYEKDVMLDRYTHPDRVYVMSRPRND